MSRESKIFSVNRKSEVPKRVKEYEAFGWELLSINNLDVSMSRETQNKVYHQLVKFEFEYETLREEQENLYCPKPPFAFSFILFLLLAVLFVIPGILYLILFVFFRVSYKNEYEEYEKKYNLLDEKIRRVCDDSRTVFFSRNE
ncbi:hypothetical protein N7548_01700 [Acholeplasma manati]|uniref:Uncharacterized protein n=1 Tax=Paracholeplasma manati TaxID=591373 RepID=A0ABT2YBH6_9MOLU|nr:hypothetical protein [Paracholeplasma manati]MCV2231543.1 hypothetical protein [Paracholeplasma manati]